MYETCKVCEAELVVWHVGSLTTQLSPNMGLTWHSKPNLWYGSSVFWWISCPKVGDLRGIPNRICVIWPLLSPCPIINPTLLTYSHHDVQLQVQLITEFCGLFSEAISFAHQWFNDSIVPKCGTSMVFTKSSCKSTFCDIITLMITQT